MGILGSQAVCSAAAASLPWAEPAAGLDFLWPFLLHYPPRSIGIVDQASRSRSRRW